MPRVVSAGVLAGSLSEIFSSRDLAEATLAPRGQTVFLETDGAGVLCGGEAAVAARLALHVHERFLLLEPAEEVEEKKGEEIENEMRWRVRALRSAEAGQELALWPRDDVLAAARVPYLTLHNIRGKNDYVCHECGAHFEQPNPLKVHLFLSCGAPEPRAFWAELLARLGGPGPEPRGPSPSRGPEPPAAALEALATAWGRARGAHGSHLCLYCGKAYSRKYGLKIHIRTHTGYKPLRCRHCLRAFGDPSNLNKHERLHRRLHGRACPADSR